MNAGRHPQPHVTTTSCDGTNIDRECGQALPAAPWCAQMMLRQQRFPAPQQMEGSLEAPRKRPGRSAFNGPGVPAGKACPPVMSMGLLRAAKPGKDGAAAGAAACIPGAGSPCMPSAAAESPTDGTAAA